jgi:YidC/Oxa1 family membrane protein insertase
VNPVQPQDKFSPQLRIFAAALLSMAVILLWAKYFAPKPQLPPPNNTPPKQTGPAATSGAGAANPTTATPSSPSAKAASSAPPLATPPSPTKPVSATTERQIVVENDLYRVELSNRGGVATSWQLKKYKDDSKPPRILDLVHAPASEQNGWPMGLVLDDAETENAANSSLYQVSSDGSQLSAPADVTFTWSDGRVEVTKKFHFDHSYVARVDASVKVNGRPVPAGIAWLGGFGDLTVTNPIPIETVFVFYSENGGRITALPHKKLEGPEKWPPGVWQGGKDFTGIEDRYFVAAFLPPNGAAPGTLETRYWRATYNFPVQGQQPAGSEPVPEVATATAVQPTDLRVYVGPKDYDVLKRMNPPLHGLVNFGWLEFIADPLFHAMKWIHNYIPNWGWTIVVLTLLLNMLLFPLRISSYRTTLKMQKVAPEIKAIQERYKKYKMNDPRKAEMNKEVMAVYQREGVNPVGGCIPQLLQFPIWFGLYRALQGTIELRHAPWIFWVKDLSAKDPYYILPVLMGVSMYLSSKMTPMTATDPQQQAMMKFMPLSMAALFIFIPYPSGLAVYILTSGLVGILQQWYLNRQHPMPAPASGKAAGKGKKK